MSSQRPALLRHQTSPQRSAAGPQGPGAFIAFPTMLGGYESAIDKAADLGLKWLAPRGGQRGRDGNWTSTKAIRAIAKAKSKGIAIYPWCFSHPDSIAAEIEMYRQFILEGASGVIVDAEDPWKSGTNNELQAQKRALAVKFMDDLRRVLPDTFIAHCPYAYPLYHWDFPYAEFNAGCDMVMPQLYWSEFNNAGFDKHWSAVASQWMQWNAKNPTVTRPIAHIGNTYGSELRGVLHPPPGVMTVSDFESFIRVATQTQSCVPLYSLEASKPDILEAMLCAWNSNVLPTHDTRYIQEALTALGFNPGPIDNKFGPRTAAALRSFQQAFIMVYREMNTKGIVDEATLFALEREREVKRVAHVTPDMNTEPRYRLDHPWAESPVIEEGSVGREVFLDQLAHEMEEGADIVPPMIAQKWGAHAFEQRAAELTAWDRKPFSVRDTCVVECNAIV